MDREQRKAGSSWAMEHIYAYNETTVDDPEGISAYRQRTVYRDKDIPNRFWFQFPSELRTAERNENIVGVRSFTMTNGDRHCRFVLDIQKTEVETGYTNKISVGIGCHLSQFNTFDKLITDIRYFVRKMREKYEEEWEKDGIPVINEYNIGYKFEREPSSEIMSFVLEGRDQLNAFGSEAEGLGINAETEAETESAEAEGLGASAEPKVFYETELRIRDLDEDAKNLLLISNPPDEFAKKIYFPGVWDRNPILLKSNLAVNSFRNYIGYTNRIYTPIKYFNLKSNDTYFWIEMYNGNDHISPAIIPMDGRDSFILEIVIC